MNKFIGIHGGDLAKKLFANASSESVQVWQVDGTDFLKYLLSNSKEDYLNWIITQSEKLDNQNRAIILDETLPGSFDTGDVECYYVNLTDIDGEFYDTTINTNDKNDLNNKINILLK